MVRKRPLRPVIGCGGHLGFCRMPKINSVRGFSDIKAILKCEVNLTRFQDIAFTSIILYRVLCCGGHLGFCRMAQYSV